MMNKICLAYFVYFLAGILAFHPAKAQTALVGMTSKGGNYGMGTLFSIIPGDTALLQHHSLFSASPGSQPGYTHCIEAANGKLYGMTTFGGIHNMGVIFEYDYTTNTYSRVYDFKGVDGSYPYGSLTEVSNGKLYGMARQNGIVGDGVIFEYDYLTNTYTKKFDMNSSSGYSPWGSLIKGVNNKLYGMNFAGGAFGKGVIFEYDYISGIYNKKVDFDGINGAGGIGSLVQASNGHLYGMTLNGGTSNKGVIFEYDYLTGTYIKLFDFDGINGSAPCGSLIEASNGKLYGLTSEGGWSNKGVLFEYDYVSNTFTKKEDLQLPTGGEPFGSMIEVNGLLYGVTSDGGSFNKGAVFEYDFVNDTYTKKADLNGSNGNAPQGSLVEAGNGKLYGLTLAGGAYGQGVVFEYNPATNIIDRKISLNSSNGSAPYGSLMQTANGKLYGMTSEGGTSNKGVIFEYEFNTNTYTKKVDISSCQGDTPYGSLIQAPNGKFYGVTFYGGTYNEGIYFEYDSSSNSCTKLTDFLITNGRNPYSSPVLVANGKIYGITSNGGTSGGIGCGVIYEYDFQSGTFIKKKDLSTGPGGCHPRSGMVEANGKLYGMTQFSGGNYWGVIFEYDYLTNTYQKKHDFDNINGSYPSGSLMQAANGKFYGMTPYGGTNGKGVLFEYDLGFNVVQKLFDFNGNNGSFPFGSLMQASNGKLYGMTREGGTFNQGVLFEYDYTSYTFIKKLDFADSIGSYPEYGHLIEINLSNVGIATSSPVSNLQVYPNPADEKVTVEFTAINANEKLVFRLTDISGREVKRSEIAISNGFNRTEIDLTACNAGIYLLHMIDAKGSSSVKKIAVK